MVVYTFLFTGSANTLTYFNLSSPLFLPSDDEGSSEITVLDGFPFASLSFSSVYVSSISWK